MKIKQLLDKIAAAGPDALFFIPRDVLSNGESMCFRDAAAERVAYYDRFWGQLGVETTFAATPRRYMCLMAKK